jgi:hypothetical protein
MARKNIIFKIEDLNYVGRLKFVFFNSIILLFIINIFLIPLFFISSWEDDVDMNWNYIIYLSIYSLFFSLILIPISNTKIKKLCQIGVVSIILILMIIFFYFDVSKIEKFHLIEAVIAFSFYISLDKISTLNSKKKVES